MRPIGTNSAALARYRSAGLPQRACFPEEEPPLHGCTRDLRRLLAPGSVAPVIWSVLSADHDAGVEAARTSQTRPRDPRRYDYGPHVCMSDVRIVAVKSGRVSWFGPCRPCISLFELQERERPGRTSLLPPWPSCIVDDVRHASASGRRRLQLVEPCLEQGRMVVPETGRSIEVRFAKGPAAIRDTTRVAADGIRPLDGQTAYRVRVLKTIRMMVCRMTLAQKRTNRSLTDSFFRARSSSGVMPSISTWLL